MHLFTNECMKLTDYFYSVRNKDVWCVPAHSTPTCMLLKKIDQCLVAGSCSLCHVCGAGASDVNDTSAAVTSRWQNQLMLMWLCVRQASGNRYKLLCTVLSNTVNTAVFIHLKFKTLVLSISVTCDLTVTKETHHHIHSPAILLGTLVRLLINVNI